MKKGVVGEEIFSRMGNKEQRTPYVVQDRIQAVWQVLVTLEDVMERNSLGMKSRWNDQVADLQSLIKKNESKNNPYF